MEMDAVVVNVLGRAVELAVRGAGAPSIVLESGSGDDLSSWVPVFGALAERRRTFSYSRPGYGRSDAVLTPRDPCTEASELRQLLCALGENPPYLLVGHSLGGLIMHAFASRYPHDIAGLVMVDPSHPDRAERMRRDIPEDARVRADLIAKVNGVPRQELDALSTPDVARSLRELKPYPGPVVVLGAWEVDHFNMYKRLREHHRMLLQETAACYPQGELRRVSCGHYIHHERPQAVLDAVDDLLRHSSERSR
jgi:pimeloyl-ACP methyl ester carboxylesterase